MINGFELRLGNIVLFNGKPVSVAAINSEDGNEIEEYSPIELTEEILLKCGFRKGSIDYELETTNIGGEEVTISIFFPSKAVSLYYYDVLDMPVNIEHLHTMQNFVFATTGKELIYDPK